MNEKPTMKVKPLPLTIAVVIGAGLWYLLISLVIYLVK